MTMTKRLNVPEARKILREYPPPLQVLVVTTVALDYIQVLEDLILSDPSGFECAACKQIKLDPDSVPLDKSQDDYGDYSKFVCNPCWTKK